MAEIDEVKEILNRIYGEKKSGIAFKKILPLIERFPVKKSDKTGYFSQEDVVLITYGDTLRKNGEAPLSTFYAFAKRYLKEAISTVHFLPFFPPAS